jgi:DNA (cytosine-5)-methyltransferase 1
MTDGINIIDIYCGAGGFSHGFDGLDELDVIAAFDAWDTAVATYNINRVDEHGFAEDLSTFSPSDAESKYGLEPSGVDVIVGGPPCQGFSMMGRRDPEDERSNQVQRYFDWVYHFGPSVWMMENVPGLLSMGDGKVIDNIVETGEEMGYAVDYRVINADEYEVPQSRKRLVVVGYKTESWEWPEPVTPDNPVPCGYELDSISEVAATGPGDEPSGWAPNHHSSNPWASTIERYLGEVEHGGDMYGGETQIRLDPTKPARTIIGSNAHWHPYLARELTIREQANLQTFRSWYHFEGTKADQQRQVGNAVPRKVAQHLGQSVIDAFLG